MYCKIPSECLHPCNCPCLLFMYQRLSIMKCTHCKVCHRYLHTQCSHIILIHRPGRTGRVSWVMTWPKFGPPKTVLTKRLQPLSYSLRLTVPNLLSRADSPPVRVWHYETSVKQALPHASALHTLPKPAAEKWYDESPASWTPATAYDSNILYILDRARRWVP